ncbi:NADase-type glycan-binding domain-containing protein [Streptomyces shenzhenensis]|uniref:NADase-type glycan-binding domain-containing protein n=1 Tax=Streptomyces shenzhenensis TaxID=943815 RepID=UPI0036C4779C
MSSQTSGAGRDTARSCAECGTRAEPGQSFCESCGSVLGWSGGPDRSDAARREPVRADGAAPAHGSAPGSAVGASGRAADGPSREGAGADGGASGERDGGDRPGWDAFARPETGTGTARTGHDPALAGTALPGSGRQGGDEARWRGGGAERSGAERSGAERSGADDWPERDTAPRTGSGLQGAPGQAGQTGGTRPGAGSSGPRGADTARGSGTAAGTGQPDTASASGPDGTWRSPTEPAGSPTTPPLPPRSGNSASASTGSGAVSPHRQGPATAATGPAAGASSPGRADGAHPHTHPDTDWDDDADTEPVPSAAERARSLLIPVSDPEPRAPANPAVAPVLPGRPVANRPQVRTPNPGSGPDGGLPCPWCATPNHPDRHYCGRCAMPMAGGDRRPSGRQPWWRRVPGFRAEETPWAGDRPRLRRGYAHVMNWVVGALVLALTVTLVLNIGAGIDATRDHFAKRAPVVPTSVKASRSYAGHGAGLAFDKLSNTWWGPGVAQSGEGEWLEARFDRPTRLLDLIVTSGVSTKVDELQESALPRRIEAQITTADGRTSTRTITLDQSAGGQRRKFRVGEVVAVRFVLRSAYAAGAKKQVSIAEIEFFGRSNSNTS